MTIETIRVNVDGARQRSGNPKFLANFGSGWRLLLLVDPGRKNVTVFEPFTLRKARVAIASLRPVRGAELSPARWRRLATAIERHRKIAKRAKRSHPAELIRRILQACRAQAVTRTKEST